MAKMYWVTRLLVITALFASAAALRMYAPSLDEEMGHVTITGKDSQVGTMANQTHTKGVCIDLVPDPRSHFFTGDNPRDLLVEHTECPGAQMQTAPAGAAEMCASQLPRVLANSDPKLTGEADLSQPCITRRPFAKNISYKEQWNICSQMGQDGVLFEVFRHVKVTHHKYFVEFGARKPGQLNSAHLRVHCGWQGLLMDPREQKPGEEGLVTRATVTPDNINQLFALHEVPRVFDLMTLDDDSNEYWTWKALDESKFLARVVAVEVLTCGFDLHQAKVVKVKDSHHLHPYPSGTPQAYLELAATKGYCLVSIALWHMIFIYCPLLHSEDQRLTLEDLPFNPYDFHTPSCPDRSDKKKNFVEVGHKGTFEGLFPPQMFAIN